MQTGLLKKKMLLFLKVKCKHLDKLKKFTVFFYTFTAFTCWKWTLINVNFFLFTVKKTLVVSIQLLQSWQSLAGEMTTNIKISPVQTAVLQLGLHVCFWCFYKVWLFCIKPVFDTWYFFVSFFCLIQTILFV